MILSNFIVNSKLVTLFRFIVSSYIKLCIIVEQFVEMIFLGIL